MAKSMNHITDQEVAALLRWVRIFPKTRGNDSWKSRLMQAWLTGNYQGVETWTTGLLQTIRNRTNLPNDLTKRIELMAKYVKAEQKTQVEGGA